MERKLNPEQNRKAVLELLSRSRDVLALPPVVQIIIGVTSGRSSSATDLASLIENDQTLVNGILSIVNSPYYGFSKKISTVSHAVTVLGFQEVQNIVLSIAAVQLFEQRGSVFTEKIWRHSFSVGVASRMVANYFKLKIESKHFVAGLLHDIGRIFLAQYLPGKYNEMLALLERGDNKVTYHAVEEGFFGISHHEVGGKLLELWRFPIEIIEAVENHHEPSRALSNQSLAICVHLADLICTIKGISPLGDRYFLTVDKHTVPVMKSFRPTLSTQDLFTMMNQLDLELERQSGFVSAYRH